MSHYYLIWTFIVALLLFFPVDASPFSSFNWVRPRPSASSYMTSANNPWYRPSRGNVASSNPWYVGGESKRGIVERRPATEEYGEDEGPVARMMRIFGFLPPKEIPLSPTASTELQTTATSPSTTHLTSPTVLVTSIPSTTTQVTEAPKQSSEEEMEEDKNASLEREVCPFFAEPLIKYRSYIECNPRSFKACDVGYLCDRSPVYNRHICCKDSTGFVSVIPQTETPFPTPTPTIPSTTTPETTSEPSTETVQFRKNFWTPWEATTQTEVPMPASWAAWAANTPQPWQPMPVSPFLPPYTSTLPSLPPKGETRERKPTPWTNLPTTGSRLPPGQWATWGKWTNDVTTPMPWSNWGTWQTPKPAWTPWNPWTKGSKPTPETNYQRNRNVQTNGYDRSSANPETFKPPPGDPEVKVTPLTTGRAVKLPNGDFEWETTITLIQDGTVKILVDTGVPTDTNAILRG